MFSSVTWKCLPSRLDSCTAGQEIPYIHGDRGFCTVFKEPVQSSLHVTKDPFSYYCPIYAEVSHVAFSPETSLSKLSTHFLFPHERYTSHPSQRHWFNRLDNIRRRARLWRASLRHVASSCHVNKRGHMAANETSLQKFSVNRKEKAVVDYFNKLLLHLSGIIKLSLYFN
jgi:hypothetical protein